MELLRVIVDIFAGHKSFWCSLAGQTAFSSRPNTSVKRRKIGLAREISFGEVRLKIVSSTAVTRQS